MQGGNLCVVKCALRVYLQVTVTGPQDGGTFVCRAQNKDGTGEEKVELMVEGGAIAPQATVHQTDMMAIEGQTVTMHCQATGSTHALHTLHNTRQAVLMNKLRLLSQVPPHLLSPGLSCVLRCHGSTGQREEL